MGAGCWLRVSQAACKLGVGQLGRMGIEIPLLLRFEPVLQQFQTGALIGAGVAGARAIAVVQPQLVMLRIFSCEQARIQAAVQPFVTASEQYIAGEYQFKSRIGPIVAFKQLYQWIEYPQ